MRRPGAAAGAAAEEGPRAVPAPAMTLPAIPKAGQAPAEVRDPQPVVYRFTVKGNNLYAIAQSWPGKTAVITTLATSADAAKNFPNGMLPEGKIVSVTMLGHAGNLRFIRDAEGLKVQLPAAPPCDYAYTLKIVGLKMNPSGPPIPAVMADLR